MTLKAETVYLGKGNGQMKAITHIPGWLDSLEGKDKVGNAAQAYALVPLIFRAVRLRCDAITDVPIKIYAKNSDQEKDWPFEDTDPAELIWQTEAALLLAGAAYWKKLQNRVRTVDLQWINPWIVHPKMENGELVFQVEGEGEDWDRFQVVYFKEFNPLNDIGPGTAAASVALEDSKLLRYITRFASRYFENGTMPVTLLGFEYAPSEAEQQRVESWFKRQATGIRNAWRILALRGKIEPQQLTPAPKDLEMVDLTKQASAAVAQAFGVPQTMLEDAANYATAGEHRLSFWQDTVKPRGRFYQGVINRQLFNKMGLRIFFDFESMGVFQTDESKRSGALYNLVQAGMDTQTAAEQLGYQLTEEQLRRIEEKQVVQVEERVLEEREDRYGDIDYRSLESELGKWQRFASNRIKDGKPLREFESELIPAGLQGAIQGALELAELEEVGEIFEDVKRWESYP